MKIVIPKVIVPVPMSEYAPELQGKNLYVWVNPPGQVLQTYRDLVTDLQASELENARTMLEMPTAQEEKKTPLWQAFDQAKQWVQRKKDSKPEGVNIALLEWYAVLWSQYADPDTHWTTDELRMLEGQDPTFLSWMIAQTWQARSTHMDQKKKA